MLETHSLVVIIQLFLLLNSLLNCESAQINVADNKGGTTNQSIITYEDSSNTEDEYVTKSIDKCYTPNGVQGRCIEIKSCPTLLKQVNSQSENVEFIRKSRCSEIDKDVSNPKVCCATSEVDNITYLDEIESLNKTETTTAPPSKCSKPNLKDGICIPIKKCPPLVDKINSKAKELEQLISQLSCDPDEKNLKNAKVCCPMNGTIEESIISGRTPNTEGGIFPNDCGQQFIYTENRIVGGSETSPNEFPWLGLLVHSNEPEGKRYLGCSAFLVHKRFLITAAHCATGQLIQKRGPLTSVFLGGFKTESFLECLQDRCANLTVGQIENVQVHPDYRPAIKGQYNDITLIKLKESIQFSDFVQPICLNTKSFYTPERYIIGGWGKTETDNMSSTKMKVAIPPAKKSSCSNIYSTQRVKIEDSQICAGGETGKDTCQGDSGGPLMYEGTNKTYYAAGVTSFGVGCGVGSWPGVYTNISFFLPWLEENMTKMISNL